MGPRRSSLHSVRFGQLLVTLCTSTHCQCNESVHRKEQWGPVTFNAPDGAVILQIGLHDLKDNLFPTCLGIMNIIL